MRLDKYRRSLLAHTLLITALDKMPKILHFKLSHLFFKSVLLNIHTFEIPFTSNTIWRHDPKKISRNLRKQTKAL